MSEIVQIRKSDLERMIKELRYPKVWVDVSEFTAKTGLTKHQVQARLKKHPEFKRKRDGLVQVNIKEYNEYYHQ